MEEVSKMLVGIVSLIVAVAIVALLVSRNAQTPQVIQSMGSALGNNLGVAEAPVTGAPYQVNLNYPGYGMSGMGFGGGMYQ